MDLEKRSHPRFNPKGLNASVAIHKHSDKTLETAGEIIDISYTGIKIKLNSPLTAAKNDQIKITLTLPNSGITVTINGVVKHCLSSTECGLYYADNHPEDIVDDLMFECIKLTQ